MKLWAHLIMFNLVSRINAQTTIPQRDCKCSYLTNFKMSCVIIHKRYGVVAEIDYERMLIEIGHYVVPIRPGRKDRKRSSPISPVYFMYRVA